MIDDNRKVTRMECLRLSGAGIIAGVALLSGFTGCSGGDTGTAACAQCPMRERYDREPASLPGRLWKWHIGFCPGWKAYLSSLPEGERKLIEEKYR